MSRESPVLREHAWRDSPKRTIPTFGGVLPMDMVGAEVGTDALADFPALDAGTDCDDLEGSIGCWDQVVCRAGFSASANLRAHERRSRNIRRRV